MRDSRAILAGLCGAGCLVILTWMLVSHAWPLWTGEVIYLRVRPVDPRDLFRGDYVVLGYDLNRFHVLAPGESLTTEELADPDRTLVIAAAGDWWPEDPGELRENRWEIWHDLRGSSLCVQLEEETPGEPGALPLQRPVSVAERPLPDRRNLCGRLRNGLVGTVVKDGPSRPILEMHYGIDALFIQEGTGHVIEEAIRNDAEVIAAIAVTSSGSARLKDLIIDGAPILGEN